MRQVLPWIVTALAMSAAGIVAVRSRPSPDASSPARVAAERAEPAFPGGAGASVKPVPEVTDVDERKRALGERLFRDPRLSRDHTVSCASCHDVAAGGDDGRRLSKGVDGAESNLNAPTVLNVRFDFRQFWDGRTEVLEEQVAVSLTQQNEMASSWPAVLAPLTADASYAADFRSAYSDGVTRENVMNAIAEFERSLVTPNARFDRFLRGDTSALAADEKQGWGLFQELGCIMCHQGVNLGGNSFQNFGVTGDYFTDRGADGVADQGRFNVTKNPRDRHRFKVPTLRNVALTAPYYHDGSVSTLDEAVKTMARYQVGFELGDDEVAKLVAFLKTLTGDSPGH